MEVMVEVGRRRLLLRESVTDFDTVLGHSDGVMRRLF